MSEHNWGTKAIIEAPIRETEHTLIVDVNRDSSSRLETSWTRTVEPFGSTAILSRARHR